MAQGSKQAATDEGTYYVIQRPGSPRPTALVADRGRGLYEWWTGEETGWVDTPHFVSYFAGGEPGAFRVDLEDLDDWKASIRIPDPMEVELLRAKGPGTTPPKRTPTPDDGPPEEPEEPEQPEQPEEPVEEPAAETEDETEPEGTPGKPKKGVNPFPKKK